MTTGLARHPVPLALCSAPSGAAILRMRIVRCDHELDRTPVSPGCQSAPLGAAIPFKRTVSYNNDWDELPVPQPLRPCHQWLQFLTGAL